MFNKNDVQEFKDSVRWFMGWGPRPDYGRYTYWEKFDYFAVFWGVQTLEYWREPVTVAVATENPEHFKVDATVSRTASSFSSTSIV